MGGSSSSKFEVKQFPGLFDDDSNTTGQNIGQSLLDLAPQILGNEQSGLPRDLAPFNPNQSNQANVGGIGFNQLEDLSGLAQNNRFSQALGDSIFNPQFGRWRSHWISG